MIELGKTVLSLLEGHGRVSEMTLISGGSAWCDHLAVWFYLTGKVKSLELHLPSKFDMETERFAGDRCGKTLNSLHKNMKGDTLGEVADAIGKGAKVTVHKGFYSRNKALAKSCDMLMAVSVDGVDKPSSAGTRMTWNFCEQMYKKCSLVKIHSKQKDVAEVSGKPLERDSQPAEGSGGDGKGSSSESGGTEG